MCDQTEIVYDDGEVVWVKLGPTWWPGQVLDRKKAPPDALNSFRKPPIAVVKFFQEETLEFVKNYNQIYKYNCSRKHEFIRKGLDQHRAKQPNMELFPAYVCEAETLTHGDPDIIYCDEFKPSQKVDYHAIFSPGVEKKPKIKTFSPKLEDTPKITHPRILQKFLKGTSDYKAHILVQELRKDGVEEVRQLEPEEETMIPPPAPTPPRTPATPGPLTCYACSYTCNRIGVMVLHNKMHSVGYVPYTPPKKPKARLSHSTPKIKLSPKLLSAKKSRGRPKKMSLPEYETLSFSSKPVKHSTKPSPISVKRKTKDKDIEKPKTDIEIKNSLLADWSESSNDSLDILSSVNLCEKPKPAASPKPQSLEPSVEDDKKSLSGETNESPLNKPSEVKKADCFDFDDDDDEELTIEAISRKIPRLSTKSEDNSKKALDLNSELLDSVTSTSVEDEKAEVDLDSKINDFLQETKLPELPTLPSEPKFIQENNAIKDDLQVDDKKEIAKPQQKTIFKTKTFFRSRHSRSQDAIEKYVADNTSVDKPPTYMEECEQSENPSDVSSVLTPPSNGSQTKIPKFAPKIQLKKLKAAMSEQSKPQVNKFSDDKWDNDSLDKLINSTSQHDKCPESNYTTTGLLGTIEESPAVIQNMSSEDNKKVDKDFIDSSQSISKVPEKVIVEKDIGEEIHLAKETLDSKIETVPGFEQESFTTNENVGVKCVPSPNKVTNDLNYIFPSENIQVVNNEPKESPSEIDKTNANTPNKESTNVLINEDAPLIIKSDESNERSINSNIEMSTNMQNSKENSADLLSEGIGTEETSVPIESSATEKVQIESVLQIAETLINLPVTSMEFSHKTENIKMSESDKNISAAKSLVQMSESIQHDHSVVVTTETSTVSGKILDISQTSPKQDHFKPVNTSPYKEKSMENTKLFKILDEPLKPKQTMKILNSKSADNATNFSLGTSLTKPRVIIRKGTPQKDIKQPLILPSPKKTVQPKEEEALFDINSMPIVLSEEILTPENIPKLPMVVSDVPVSKTEGPLILSDKVNIRETLLTPTVSRPEIVKKYGTDAKTIVKPVNDKSNMPNILSKSNKVKTVKHLLVVDKHSGEQKIITSESFEDRPPVTITKVVKRSPTIISRGQTTADKFILLPSNPSQKTSTSLPTLTKISGAAPKISPTMTKPSPIKKTQKIMINPQTGAQMYIEDSTGVDKPKQMTTKAKIIQNKVSTEPTGNAVMIITNSQGVQSKIVLTPEHQKVLFSKKPGQLTLTTQTSPQVKGLSGIQPSRSKAIAVTSQSIITSRGQIMNPISGNALITSTGQLLPAQTSSTSSILTKQTGSIISSTKVIPPGERVIITGKPNQTILTSKGQLIMTQMAPSTSHSKISTYTSKFATSTISSSSQIASSPIIQKSILGKPKQTPTKTGMPPIIKSNSKIISGDLATLLQGKKPGTVMHLTAAQFEHLQKTGQIVQQPPLTQIIQTQKGKQNAPKLQTPKIIVQKQTPTLKQLSPIGERKMQQATQRNMPNLIQTKVSTPPPPKKQKLRELLSMDLESNQMKKKKPIATYPGPTKQVVEPKVDQPMDLGNLDELIPATTISTRKGEVSISEGSQSNIVLPPSNIVDTANKEITTSISELNAPSTSLQSQETVQADTSQQMSGGLGDGQLLAVPGENFGGPPNSFYLCVEENGTFTPIDNQPLVLENNQLVPMVIPPVLPEFLNTEDQILVDQQTLLSLLGGNSGDRLVTGDNQQLLLQGDVRQLMAALTPQAAPNQDILAAALADTDVFQSDALVPEGLGVVTGPPQGMLVEMESLGGDFQNLNAAVTVHSNVETSTTLKQPIMSPVEIPSKKRIPEDKPHSESIEDSLAVIGVTPPTVPSTLDLPITVTDPRIAPKTTNPLSLTCGALYAAPTLILSPTTATIDAYTTSLLSDKTSEASFTSPSSGLVTSETTQDVTKKAESTSHLTDKSQLLKKLPASSMPCLDDSSSDSYASENPQQLTEAIQTKTYSPISMPLLTDDPPVMIEPVQEVDTTDQKPLKSMPVLLESEEIALPDNSQAIDTNMPLLDDSQEGVEHCENEAEVKVQTNKDLIIPNSVVLPNDIFNESCNANDNPEPIVEETVISDAVPPTETVQNHSEHPVEAQHDEIASENIEKIPEDNIQDSTLRIEQVKEDGEQNSVQVVSVEDNAGTDITPQVVESDITATDNLFINSVDNNVIVDSVKESDLYEDSENSHAISAENIEGENLEKIESEPAEGIPIIVTTEETESGGVVVDVDLDVAPPSVPSPTGGNSLPHAEEDPFSDASSDASAEIPLQPPISVSQLSLSTGRNGDSDKRPATPNSLDLSPKRFKYDDER